MFSRTRKPLWCLKPEAICFSIFILLFKGSPQLLVSFKNPLTVFPDWNLCFKKKLIKDTKTIKYYILFRTRSKNHPVSHDLGYTFFIHEFQSLGEEETAPSLGNLNSNQFNLSVYSLKNIGQIMPQTEEENSVRIVVPLRIKNISFYLILMRNLITTSFNTIKKTKNHILLCGVSLLPRIKQATVFFCKLTL